MSTSSNFAMSLAVLFITSNVVRPCLSQEAQSRAITAHVEITNDTDRVVIVSGTSDTSVKGPIRVAPGETHPEEFNVDAIAGAEWTLLGKYQGKKVQTDSQTTLMSVNRNYLVDMSVNGHKFVLKISESKPKSQAKAKKKSNTSPTRTK